MTAPFTTIVTIFILLLSLSCKEKSVNPPFDTSNPPIGVFLPGGGTTLEKISYRDLKGVERRIEPASGGAVLVNLWATWCPPCIEELPTLTGLQSRWREDHFQIVAISVGDETPAVESFIQSNGVDLQVGVDPMQYLLEELQVNSIPVTLLYSSDGEELFRVYGYMDWDSPEVRKRVKEFLK